MQGKTQTISLKPCPSLVACLLEKQSAFASPVLASQCKSLKSNMDSSGSPRTNFETAELKKNKLPRQSLATTSPACSGVLIVSFEILNSAEIRTDVDNGSKDQVPHRE
jgi:hypothetical protein